MASCFCLPPSCGAFSTSCHLSGPCCASERVGKDHSQSPLQFWKTVVLAQRAGSARGSWGSARHACPLRKMGNPQPQECSSSLPQASLLSMMGFLSPSPPNLDQIVTSIPQSHRVGLGLWKPGTELCLLLLHPYDKPVILPLAEPALFPTPSSCPSSFDFSRPLGKAPPLASGLAPLYQGVLIFRTFLDSSEKEQTTPGCLLPHPF
jgi:hypothetical protein